jgi:hypothetical protein
MAFALALASTIQRNYMHVESTAFMPLPSSGIEKNQTTRKPRTPTSVVLSTGAAIGRLQREEPARLCLFVFSFSAAKNGHLSLDCVTMVVKQHFKPSERKRCV